MYMGVGRKWVNTINQTMPNSDTSHQAEKWAFHIRMVKDPSMGCVCMGCNTTGIAHWHTTVVCTRIRNHIISMQQADNYTKQPPPPLPPKLHRSLTPQLTWWRGKGWGDPDAWTLMKVHVLCRGKRACALHMHPKWSACHCRGGVGVEEHMEVTPFLTLREWKMHYRWEKNMPLRRKWWGFWCVTFSILCNRSSPILWLPNCPFNK